MPSSPVVGSKFVPRCTTWGTAGQRSRTHSPAGCNSNAKNVLSLLQSGKSRHGLRQADRLLGARFPVVLAEPVNERRLQLSRALELLDDVGAAYELALDEDLGDRRPAGHRRQILAD